MNDKCKEKKSITYRQIYLLNVSSKTTFCKLMNLIYNKQSPWWCHLCWYIYTYKIQMHSDAWHWTFTCHNINKLKSVFIKEYLFKWWSHSRHYVYKLNILFIIFSEEEAMIIMKIYRWWMIKIYIYIYIHLYACKHYKLYH